MLAVKHVRRTQTTLAVMVGSCAASAPLLWAAAVLSGETLLPASAAGWTVLVGLALVSQVIGQGLIAFAFRHLPAAFSALSLLLQPVVAAVLAALLLGEDLSLLQAGGGLVVLVGIAVASQRPRG
jgi:drug/metabolite transporter (DMT)-like permease